MTRTGGWLADLGLLMTTADPFVLTGGSDQNTRAINPRFFSFSLYTLVPMRVLSTNCSVASSMALPRLPFE